MKKNEVVNPVDEYRTEGFPKQYQPSPGIQARMKPVPDCGEESYVGHGRLAGRKALITGGDSGIGRAVAIAFAREGAEVTINYLPSEQEDADSLAALLKKEGVDLKQVAGDVTDEKFCYSMVEKAVKEMGGLDILVLNAGTQTAVADIENLSTEQLRHTFEVNVFSMFWITKAALRHMTAGASIITTSSIQDFLPGKSLLDYAATKGAITDFTRALAKQIAKDGIRVNSVAPGPIWTALQVTGGQLQEDLPEFGQNTPLGRAGQPAELAGVYVYLASHESSYVTAEVYGVTGGHHTT